MREKRRARTVAPRAAITLPPSGAILPVQFQDLCRRSVCRSGGQRLALAVLGQAVDDLRKHRWARSRGAQRIYRDAYQWVDATDRSWPYSFVNVCESLQLSPAALRVELLGGGGTAEDVAA